MTRRRDVGIYCRKHIAAIFIAGGAWISSVAADDAHFFELEVCNGSFSDVDLLIVSLYHFDNTSWSMNGWYRAAANSCTSIGSFRRGYFYLTARTSDGRLSWNGKNRYLCASTRRVERLLFENERCLAGEFKAGFYELQAISSKYTWRLSE